MEPSGLSPCDPTRGEVCPQSVPNANVVQGDGSFTVGTVESIELHPIKPRGFFGRLAHGLVRTIKSIGSAISPTAHAQEEELEPEESEPMREEREWEEGAGENPLDRPPAEPPDGGPGRHILPITTCGKN